MVDFEDRVLGNVDMNAGMKRLIRKYPDRLNFDSIDKDQDGYWVFPKRGWFNFEHGQHIIHEDSLKAIESQIRTLTNGCVCRDCVEGSR